MAQALKVIRETSFVKGYNDKLKAELLPEGFCADALNCFLDDQLITKRHGYAIAGNDPSVETAIIDLDSIEFSSGTKFLIRARNNDDGDQSIIEAWTGTGNWATITDADEQTAGKSHVFPVAKDVCYIVNDTDTVLKTSNGTSTSEVADFPNGVDAKWFHNYMFVITAAGRLYWSNLNDAETWDADDYFDVNPQDGDTTVGLAVLKDELLIFKKNRVWSLTGFGASDFTVADMGERLTGLGAQSRKSIVETGNDVYFLSAAGDIPHFRSVMRTKYGEILAGEVISDPIEGTMSDLAVAEYNNCAGIFDGRKIWWAVSDDQTYNDLVLVYDTLTKGWTRHTGINASCWARSTVVGGYPQLYFGEASADALCFRMSKGATSDNGTAIDMQFKTRMYNPYPESKCKWKYLYIAGEVVDDVEVDIDYSPDGFTFDDLTTFDLTGTGSVFPITLDLYKFGTTTVARKRVDWGGGTSYKMQYKFTNNTATDAVRIREFQVLYKPRGLRAVADT